MGVTQIPAAQLMAAPQSGGDTEAFVGRSYGPGHMAGRWAMAGDVRIHRNYMEGLERMHKDST